MSKHHVGQVRYCVGGRWAGSGQDPVFPCLERHQHETDCEDRDNCPGCLPRLADNGWLCGTHHRYLAQWLGADEENGLVRVRAWLLANLAGMGSSEIKDNADQRAAAINELPSAMREDIFDCVRLIDDRVFIGEERARQAGVGSPLIEAGPWSFESGVEFLRSRLVPIEDDALLVGELFRHLQDSMVQAHVLAPWRRKATKVRADDGPIPCPHCEHKTLMQFGGDDFVTCTWCGNTITDERFGIWTRMLEEGKA